MKKILLVLVLLFLPFCFSEPIPLSYTTEKEYIGNEQWKLTKFGIPKYYLNDLNEFTEIDSNFQGYLFEEWTYQVNKGLYSLGVKNDGTTGFRYKNKGVTLRLLGIGFYNTDTQERIIRTGITLSEPDINANKITWQLPHGATYAVEYQNKYWHDILVIPQAVKNYLWNNRPDGWTAQNTWVGLIFDLNTYNINFQNFDTNQTIHYTENGERYFSIPARKVYHELHQSGAGDFNNEGREWQKKLIYYNGYYIEAIPVTALQSEDGYLYWNATINLTVTRSDFDGDESSGFFVETSDPEMVMSALMWGAGISFEEVGIADGDIISEAILTVKYGWACSGIGNCHVNIHVAHEDCRAWSSTYKMSDANKSVAFTNWDETTDFTPNGSYGSIDLNLTLPVRELITDSQTGTWIEDGNLCFVIEKDGFGRRQNITAYSYDHASIPEPAIEIIYEGEGPNLCLPTLNEDYVFTDKTLYCLNRVMVTGSGRVFLDNNSFLGLTTSSMFLTNFISFEPPDLNKEQFTTASQINVSSGDVTKENLAHLEGGDPHGESAWFSAELQLDHYAEVDFGYETFVYDVSFPVEYTINRFSDLNIMYYNSDGWHTAWSDSSFNMGIAPDSCDWNGLGTYGNYYYCDINKSINAIASKVRLSARHSSKSAGAKFNSNSIFAGEDIIIHADDPNRWYLELEDSNFNVN